MSETNRVSRPGLLWRIGIIAALVGAAAWVWPTIAAWQQASIADELALAALAADGNAAEPAVRRLADLGDAGAMRLAILALGRPSPAATAARFALLDEIARWENELKQTGDAARFAGRLAVLATNLQLHVDRADAAGFRWAQRLARRLVADCESTPAEESIVVLRACDRVLSADPPHSEALASTPAVRPSLQTIPDAPSAPVESIAAAEAPEIAPAPAEAPVEPKVADPHSRAARPLASLQLVPYDDPEQAAASTRPGSALQTPPNVASIAPAPSASAPIDVPSPADAAVLRQQLRQLSDRELLARYPTAERFEAAVIRQVLAQRGYADAVLDAVTRLGRSPVEQRRDALQRIDALPAAQCRVLLRWFVEDQDAEIRLEALSKLATSSDPQLGQILRQRAIEDHDPRVAAMANRILGGLTQK